MGSGAFKLQTQSKNYIRSAMMITYRLHKELSCTERNAIIVFKKPDLSFSQKCKQNC